MANPYKVVEDFERALSEYTGAPYVVTTNSCTNALQICLDFYACIFSGVMKKEVTIRLPKYTYCSVPMACINAGFKVQFDDRQWRGTYQLNPLQIWDSARRFTKGMWKPGQMQCVSFHWNKILGIQQGGAVLLGNKDIALRLRRQRFDGRTAGIAPKDDEFIIGRHCYMSPEIAAEGLIRLSFLPEKNEDLPNDDYPDLSLQQCFKEYTKR